MTAQNQSNDLNAIKTSLLKIAQDIAPATPAPGQAAPPGAAQPGSPEEVLGLIDDAIQVLEVASESVPAENAVPGQAPAPAAPQPATAKSKSAQSDDDDDDKVKDAADDDDDDKVKEATDDEDTDKEKELKARIAALEDDKEEEEKEKIAKEFVQLYPENIRQAKFDAIIASKVKSAVLTEQFKVAQDLSEATHNKNQYVPITASQSGFLTKQARLTSTVKPWRT